VIRDFLSATEMSSSCMNCVSKHQQKMVRNRIPGKVA
jgi:hypothetical protein